jgi:hypothetical protein
MQCGNRVIQRGITCRLQVYFEETCRRTLLLILLWHSFLLQPSPKNKSF